MKSEIKYWEYIILSGKKIEPHNKEQESIFELASYVVSQKNKKVA